MENRKTISQRFTVRLAVIVVVALTVSTMVLFVLNTDINIRNYNDIIESTLTDIEKDIEDTSDISMLEKTRRIREMVEEMLLEFPNEDTWFINEVLQAITVSDELSEMSIVNADNTVIYSSREEYIGFDMNSNEDSRAFDALNHGAEEIVQPVRKNAYQGDGNYDEYNKYAGVPLTGGGYLQVAINSQQFQQQIDAKVRYIAANRHVGQKGIVIVANMQGTVVSYTGKDEKEVENLNLSDIGIHMDSVNGENDTFFCGVNGVEHLLGARMIEGYYVIGAVPTTEVQQFRKRATGMNTVIEVIIFVLMFLSIRKMIHSIIVSRIHNINGSLKKIIGGSLDTKVSEYSTEEFSWLSDDINATVTSLKDYMDQEKEKIRRELEFAKSIQLSALPKVSMLESQRGKVELYATMNTAKEVGGDFYDFYMLDESHLAVLIADVSGKGVPAAMFMMTCKTMIKNLTESGLALSEVFTRANQQLCRNNDAGMFVTVWMGILDLKTGDLEYVNAGHNRPLISDESGVFSWVTCRPALVLAGLEGIQYSASRVTLRPGDKLFLYTDGVTEANDPEGNLYGDERLRVYLNSVREQPMKDMLYGLQADLDAFAREAEQFDDITMIGLRYIG